MKIDRLKIANGLKAAGYGNDAVQGITIAISEAVEEAIQVATDEMATRKDLDILSARSDARINEALKNQTFWIVGVGVSIIGIMIALKIFA